MMLYGVYYFDMCDDDREILLTGLYHTLDEAVDRLNKVLPNFQPHINNTVKTRRRIGWINQYAYGDYVEPIPVTQMHNPVDLFSQQF